MVAMAYCPAVLVKLFLLLKVPEKVTCPVPDCKTMQLNPSGIPFPSCTKQPSIVVGWNRLFILKKSTELDKHYYKKIISCSR